MKSQFNKSRLTKNRREEEDESISEENSIILPVLDSSMQAKE
jgi:hypothetical protein